MVAHRLDALDAAGNPTIAFLARGIEGLVVRITAKGATEKPTRGDSSTPRRTELRAILGDLVFGVDDETMEYAVLERLRGRGAGRSASPRAVTGGFIGARIVNVPGASDVFRGTIGAYATDVKRAVLGVDRRVGRQRGSRRARWPKARGACSAPTSASRSPASPGRPNRTASPSAPCASGSRCRAGRPRAVSTRFPGDRERIRQFATISLLNLLRQRLDALAHASEP